MSHKATSTGAGDNRLFSNKKLPFLCVLILLAVHLSGCKSKPKDFKRANAVDHVMASWVGHLQTELVETWGPPTKIVPDKEGGSIVIYESLKGIWGDEKNKRIVGGAQYAADRDQSGYAARRIFYVNEKGVITNWTWSGL
jgi:hypothetical protein